MKHPAYHLRLNKAVDRFLFVETLRILGEKFPHSEYTYYGFGGPFLEDCRLLHEYCPDISLVSIEHDNDTYQRQKFHKFTSTLKLVKKDFKDFLTAFQPTHKQIFWLDYVDMEPNRFGEFMEVLGKVADRSVVRITFKAQVDGNPFLEENPGDEKKRAFLERFESRYATLIPYPLEETFFSRPSNLVSLVQQMVRVQAEQALPPNAEGSVFQPLSTSHYTDGTHMLSVTGIVCPQGEVFAIRDMFKDWRFANLDWHQPYEINVPVFSVKERLFIEKHLPLSKIGKKKSLAHAIKYSIVESGENWEDRLGDYAEIHRYCPAFAKIVV
jgi:hypothetical protein